MTGHYHPITGAYHLDTEEYSDEEVDRYVAIGLYLVQNPIIRQLIWDGFAFTPTKEPQS